MMQKPNLFAYNPICMFLYIDCHVLYCSTYVRLGPTHIIPIPFNSFKREVESREVLGAESRAIVEA